MPLWLHVGWLQNSHNGKYSGYNIKIGKANNLKYDQLEIVKQNNIILENNHLI